MAHPLPFPEALSRGLSPKQLKVLDTFDYFVETDPMRVQKKMRAELDNAKTYHDMGWNDLFSPPLFFQGAPEALAEEGEALIHGVFSQPILLRFFTEKGVGVATSQGSREKMEDTHLITSLKTGNITAVFDGHIAKSCALHAQKQFRKLLKKRLEDPDLQTDDRELLLWNALKLTFVDVSRTFTGDEAGCCANVCILIDGAIWTANVGDSRALFVSDAQIVQLSEDAKPWMPRYREECERRGGFVTEWGTLAHPMSRWTIAPARSLGDHHLKGAMNPRPKISKFALPKAEKGCYLVQACDGVFDAAATKQVAEMVRFGHERGLTPARIALDVAAAAYQGGSEDNITILIKHLQ